LADAGNAARQTLIIVIVSLLLGEGVVRIFNYFNPLFIFYDASYNRFRGKPFSNDFDFKLNSKGFKDIEFPTQKEANTYRILALGDSFAFGVVPYKDNYLTLLETTSQQANSKVEVFNMGIPSIGPKQYESVLVREGLAYRPDLVLVSFFIGNDFYDSLSAKKREFYTYSYLASLFYYIYTIQQKYEGQIVSTNLNYCDDCANLDKPTYLSIEKDRSLLYWTDYPLFPRLLDEASHYLENIQAICGKNGIKLVVVLIPDELQINPTLQQEVRAQAPATFTPGAWDNSLPNTRLSAKLQAMGVDVIDLLPNFVGHEQTLYRPRDSHWNIAGNKLAASVIHNRLLPYIQGQAANAAH
jgi:hypothetical protein